MAGRKKGKRIAKKLELSEVKYRELFDSINVCVIVLKPKEDGEDFVIKDINAAMEKVERVRLGEFIGKSVTEALPVLVELGIISMFQRVWRTGEPERFPAIEFKAIRVKGWREGYVYRLPSGDIVAVYEDVTARIKAENALKKAELRYRTMADFAYDLEYWKGPDGKLLYISPSCERITGYSVGEFMKDPGLLDHIVVAEDRDLWESHEIRGGSFVVNEISFRIQRRDGQIRWIEHRCKQIVDENNKFLGIRGSNRDITDRKRIEQLLGDSEERFRTLFLAAPIGLALADLEGRFIDINTAFQKMLGFTRDELLGTSILEITHPDDKDLYLELSGELVRGERPGYSVEKRFVRKDGATLWVNVSTVRVETPDGRFLYRIGIIEDITDRKMAAEALIESEIRYRSLIETTGVGFASVDLEGKIVLVNDSLCEITGYTRDEIVGRPFADFVHPDDLSEAVGEFSKAISEGRTKNIFYEMKILAKDHVAWMRFNPTEWAADGRTIGMHAAMFDITDRKQAEEALITSKEHFQALFMNMTQATALYELVFDESGKPCNYRFVEVNPEYERIFDKKADDVRGKLFTEIFPAADALFLEEFSQVAFSRVPTRFETYYPYSKKFVDVSVVPWEDHGFATIVSDITERIRVDRQLQQSENKFSAAFMSSPEPMVISEIESGEIIEANPAMAKWVGYRREELIGKTTFDLEIWVNPDDRNKIIDSVRRHGEVSNLDSQMRMAEGEIRDVWLSSQFMQIGDREYLITRANDITERKRAEESLRHSEEVFRLLAENTGDVIWLADPGFKLTYISPSIRKLRGYEPEEAVSQPLIDIMTPQSLQNIMDQYEYHKADIESGIDISARVEVEQYKKDGSTVWVESVIRAVYNDDRKLTGFVGVSRDISERKKAEDALKWDVIWFADPKLKPVYISPSIRKLLGYTPEEAMSQALVNMMTPQSAQIVMDKYKSQKADIGKDRDAIVHVEVEQYRKDGSKVWVETAVRAVYNDEGKHTGFIGVSRDISGLKRTQDPEAGKPDSP
ncbi:MAG: PAS domain S-box protein [Dehalococcoidia bacterium]|jgi:PAS domain S-box-containing protein